MSLRKIIFSFLLLASFNTFAQDSTCCHHHKKMSHIVGIQANQLIRQVFNFSNNNPNINNPYLMTYTMINNKSLWGIDAGIGYTYNDIFENDGNTKKETYINDLYARIGIQKLIPLTKRFSAQMNVHLICDYLNDKTSSIQEFNFQKTTVKTNSNVIRFGGGPALGLRYKLNNKIFIGTEANYYFKHGFNKSTVSTLQEFQGQQSSFVESKIDNAMSTFLLNVPTAIFLQIKF